MNYKEKFLEMEREFAREYSREPIEDISEMKLTFFFKFQIFEPCKYVSEDDEWITFLILPPDDTLESQIMSLRKEEIVSFGILNENNLAETNNVVTEIEPESLYQ
ncbi:hypothetical protein [Methanobrevibacter sp.]|uniref:hypothetical protein n=1 Tax=Methanobrevibacter sp. TaxID=66852 RepID=UPI0025EBE1A7|nr:hypothetical protein [Methanobrevibacter sp.]MBQ6512546.1 hypothetical protein [Methanobrevibacter sp.]